MIIKSLRKVDSKTNKEVIDSAVEQLVDIFVKHIDDNSDNEETKQLMKEQDIDKDTSEKVQGMIDRGLDEEDAIGLADEI